MKTSIAVSAALVLIIASVIIFLESTHAQSHPSQNVFDPGGDGVIFTVRRIFTESAEVGVKRSPDGEIVLEAFELNAQNPDRYQRLSQFRINEETYRQITILLESPAMKNLAERYPPPGTGGWTWEFKRVSAHARIHYSFWTPEHHKDVEGNQQLVDLAKLFIDNAGLSRLFPDIYQP